MCNKRFEIQLRTGLQHIWTAINHETTYKSEFDVPREKIINNKADDIQINMISLKEYIYLNKEMRHFLWQLAAIEGSKIRKVSPESHLPQLKWLGLKTLGDVQEVLAENRELVFSLAGTTLKGIELDILASTVGLRFLCRAERQVQHLLAIHIRSCAVKTGTGYV